jgi:hypothetical protein
MRLETTHYILISYDSPRPCAMCRNERNGVCVKSKVADGRTMAMVNLCSSCVAVLANFQLSVETADAFDEYDRPPIDPTDLPNEPGAE